MRGDNRTRIGSGLLAVSCFALGAAFAAVVRGGTLWGTFGEWVGGIGALVAATIALQLGTHATRREAQRERDRAVIAAARIRPAASHLGFSVAKLKASVLEEGGETRIRRLLIGAEIFGIRSDVKHLEDMRVEASHLPARVSVTFEAVLVDARTLMIGLEALNKVGSDATPGRLQVLNSCLSAIDAVSSSAQSLASVCEGLADAYRPS